MVPAALVVAATLASTLTPHIDLYTMGPGPILFERFGHAALCVVYDQAPPLTRCYNYGMMDFRTPPLELAWSFLRGTTLFWVEADRLKPMVDLYETRDRTIWRQRLPLDGPAAKALAKALAENVKEENRYYVYHHFRDNCSTRLRDHIDRAFHGALSRDAPPTGMTYRGLGRQGLADVTPILVASDFLVGRGADKELTTYERMFLPRYLREGVKERLGVEPEVLYRRKGPPMPREIRSGRGWTIAFALLAAAVVFALRRRAPRLARWVPALLLGTLGLVTWFVAAASTIPELTRNEALLVLLPADFAIGFLGTTWLRRYLRFRVINLLLVSLLLAAGVFIQPLHTVLLIPFLVLGALLVPVRGTSPLSPGDEHARENVETTDGRTPNDPSPVEEEKSREDDNRRAGEKSRGTGTLPEDGPSRTAGARTGNRKKPGASTRKGSRRRKKRRRKA